MKMYRWTLFILVLLVLGMATAQSADERSIAVSGSGTVYGEPDVALLELGVDITDEDLSVASAEADATMRRVMEALIAAGVAEEDIQTVSYNIWREERYGPEGEPTTPVYHVVNVVRVRVEEVERAGEILSASIDAGANVVNGIVYTFSDPDALERQARELAFLDAQSKAQQLASLAGVVLGPLASLSESGGFGNGPFYDARGMMAEAASAPPISGGQLAVTVVMEAQFLFYPQNP